MASGVYRFFKVRNNEITDVVAEYTSKMARFTAESEKLKKKYGIVKYAFYEHTERKDKLDRRGVVERTSEDYMDIFAVLHKSDNRHGFTNIKAHIDVPKAYLAFIKANYDLCKLDLRTKTGKAILQEFLDIEKFKTIDKELGDYIAGYYGLLHNDVEYRKAISSESAAGVIMRYDTFAQCVRGFDGEGDVWIFAVPVWNTDSAGDPDNIDSGLHEDYEAESPLEEITATEFLKYRANTPPTI